MKVLVDGREIRLGTIVTWWVPAERDIEEARGRAAIVIDVLRASTTIVTALARGASGVWPCVEIEESRHRAAGIAGSILWGERGGLPIDGFDLGNSPSDYTSERVGGRDVVFTTTNGTKALHAARLASRCWIGAFVNRAALLSVCREERDLLLVCAGTDGRVTREDVLLAGCLAASLQDQGRTEDDATQLARQAWQGTWQGRDPMGPGELSRELARTRGGRNLTALGLGRDLDDVACWDAFGIVPERDEQSGVLRVP